MRSSRFTVALLSAAAIAGVLAGVPSADLSAEEVEKVAAVSGTPIIGSELEHSSQDVAPLPEGLRSWEAIPGVVRHDGVDSFRLEVDTNGPVTRVTLTGISLAIITPEPGPLELRDDGLGEDQVAGDSVFTGGPFSIDPNIGLFDHYGDDPDSPAGLNFWDIGTIEIEETDGTVDEFLIEPAIGILETSIPAISFDARPDVQATEHLINVRHDVPAVQLFLRTGGSPAEFTNLVYEAVPDEFDFLMALSAEHVEMPPRSSGANFFAGRHLLVKVDYVGTGLAEFDATATFGSAGRLLGFSALDTAMRGATANNATHELLHQWGAFISPSFPIIDPDRTVHYDSRSNVGSLLGGFAWLDNGDGTFSLDCDQGTSSATVASPLDRYLMGLLPGEDVGFLRVYDEAVPSPGLLCAGLEPNVIPNEAIAAEVTIGDIQASHGVRQPGPDDARSEFNIGFVIGTTDRLLTATEMTFFDILAEHYTSPIDAALPDPLISHNWPSIERFFGGDTTWTSEVPPLLAADTTPPSCDVVVPGPRARHRFVEIQDVDSGLADVTVVRSRNVVVTVPSFDEATTAVVTAHVRLHDRSRGGLAEFEVSDVAGNSAGCTARISLRSGLQP